MRVQNSRYVTAFCLFWSRGLFSLDYAIEFPNKNVTEYVHIWGMPNLTAFTVCFWMKTNDSNSGTPFSYAVPGEDNEILLIGYNNFNVYIEGTKR